MPSNPYNPSTRANPWDQTPDWASSDFPTFEKAVNGGASVPSPATAWDGGGEVIKTAGSPKAPSKLDNFRRSLNENGFTLGEATRLGARVGLYGAKHKEDLAIARGMFDNENGMITREEDRVTREFLLSIQHTADGRKALQKYNEFVSNGKIKVIP